MTLGEKMRRKKKKNNITQQQLAEDVGYSPVTISYIENGWQSKCSLPKFAKMAIVMQLTDKEIVEIVKSNA